MARNEKFVLIPILAIAFFVCPIWAQERRQGQIEFSDGKKAEGRLLFASSLQIYEKKRLRTISPDEIQRIEFDVEREKMEQMYRFPEAGRAIKEAWGKPYPVRYLNATIFFENREKITGHLYTTVLYLEQGEETRKVVLSYKQQGKEGASMDSLAYPKKIVFTENVASSDRLVISFKKALSKNAQVCGVTQESLRRMEIEKDERETWRLPFCTEEDLIVAVKADGIEIGGGGTSDKKIDVLVRTSVAFVRDFFDRKEVIGAWQDKARPENVYAFMLLSREKKTTLKQEKNLPWRLEIWRWTYEESENRLMLSGRQYFFRGIVSSRESLPPIALVPDFWARK